jgi:uncharacterized radical SAM superfamily protein
MIPATNPDDLVGIAEALAMRGARGFLLSGGVDSRGKVPLAGFIPAIRAIKSSTDLKINAHIGLTPREELKGLIESGIDSFSVDVYGADGTIRDVLGLPAKADDYLNVIRNLKDLGANVSPHLCVGIHAGRLDGELTAISQLKKVGPRNLIIISLIPTKGTAYQNARPPSRETMLSVVRDARAKLPDTKLLLGCMRSKADRSWEFDLVEAGLDGIVLPSASTVEKARAAGHSVKKRAECCALI